jgi:hypothetical protein
MGIVSFSAPVVIVATIILAVVIRFFIMGNSKSFQKDVMGASGKIATSIFDFAMPTATGESVLLSQYRGKKAYLIVNVASS